MVCAMGSHLPFVIAWSSSWMIHYVTGRSARRRGLTGKETHNLPPPLKRAHRAVADGYTVFRRQSMQMEHGRVGERALEELREVCDVSAENGRQSARSQPD